MPYRGLGLIPDTHDPRDTIFEAQPRMMIGGIPPKVDLRHLCSPVRDQGNQGSCTGFALVSGLREYVEHKTGAPKQWVELSPSFLYYQERRRENTIDDCQAGAMLRDGLKALAKVGVCPESDAPYNDRACAAPSAAATAAAPKFKIHSFERVTTLYGLKQALATGKGCPIGIAVYESFESPGAHKTGHVPMPQPGEKRLGGHALFCCGYQDEAKYDDGGYLIVKNSWGDDFGDKGYVYLPYAYVVPKLMIDMWAAN
jgi:C1A family cysteine protease